MSFRKKFTPNRIVILLFIGLFVSYFSHVFQSLFGLNKQEEIAAIILIATAILWISEALPLYITSLAVLFFQILWLLPALLETGINATKEDFLIAFFGDITLLFMGGFVLAALLNKYGISRMIARSIIEKTGNSPSRVLLSLILVSSILSMWISNTATAAMMFAIVAPVVMDLPETSPFSKASLISFSQIRVIFFLISSISFFY